MDSLTKRRGPKWRVCRHSSSTQLRGRCLKSWPPADSSVCRHSSSTQLRGSVVNTTVLARWFAIAKKIEAPTKWPKLAHFGTKEHKVAQLGTFWPNLAHFGTKRHKRAQSGTNWPKLAQNGTNWPKTAQSGTPPIFIAHSSAGESCRFCRWIVPEW
jgi:hypothetical protein